jgi:hypothetical protein
MPVRDFLEKYPLYRKYPFKSKNVPLSGLPKPAVHMYCDVCKTEQTFIMENQYYEANQVMNEAVGGQACRLQYICASCQRGRRIFVVRFDPNNEFIMKIGQYPPWDIRPDSNLEKMLGGHVDLYKKGLVCESQGYGIGGFGYYRRIVEDMIGQLLDDLAVFMSGTEKEEYVSALERVRATPIAQDKIALVKDLLPPVLRPGGINPLSVLHEILSQGLHEASDEVCMELAAGVRDALVFLVDQIEATKERRAGFTASMQKLLDRKAKRDA